MFEPSDKHAIKIHVKPNFIKIATLPNSKNVFFWTYGLTIRNDTDSLIIMQERRWTVIDEKGKKNKINYGDDEAFTVQAKESFEYASLIFLEEPSGIMYGDCICFDPINNRKILVDIPACSLDSTTKHVCN